MPSSRAVDPGSKWGAPSRRGSARIPRRAGEESDRIARSRVTTGLEDRHLGWSLAPATGKPLVAGAICASSLPAGAGVVTTLLAQGFRLEGG